MAVRNRSNLDPPAPRARRAGAPSGALPAPWLAALTPGALPRQLGWLAQPLFDAARGRPDLALQLLALDWRRLHLAALVLAHRPDADPQALADAFERGARAVAAAAVGAEVDGVVGLLDRLPPEPLEPDAYRVAVRLLRERATAPLLIRGGRIDAATIAAIDALPARLRTRPVLVALSGLDQEGAAAAAQLQAWFAMVARRLRPGLRFDPADAMAQARTEADLRTALLGVPARLSWAAAEPPREIGAARRIDDLGELRRFGRGLRNCLAYAHDDSQQLIYAWREDGVQAACQLDLLGRFGWFLGERATVGNGELPPEHEARIVAAFDAAGIPTRGVAGAYELMLDALGEHIGARDERRRRLARAQHAAAEEGDGEADDEPASSLAFAASRAVETELAAAA